MVAKQSPVGSVLSDKFSGLVCLVSVRSSCLQVSTALQPATSTGLRWICLKPEKNICFSSGVSPADGGLVGVREGSRSPA